MLDDVIPKPASNPAANGTDTARSRPTVSNPLNLNPTGKTSRQQQSWQWHLAALTENPPSLQAGRCRVTAARARAQVCLHQSQAETSSCPAPFSLQPGSLPLCLLLCPRELDYS
eukprot:337395-Hanusia_phi.AAC.1